MLCAEMKSLVSLVALSALWCAWVASAAAECLDAPDLAAYEAQATPNAAYGPTEADRLGRVVAPVHINGAGPFRFIVDTGANRSAVSQGLAERLGLTLDGSGEVHSVHGVSIAPLTRVDSMNYGDVALGPATMPVLSGPMLAGEQGLLGVDGMQGRRLRMDFDRNCIEIIPSRGAPRLRNWVRVDGELRFGHLVVIRAIINGVRTNLLIDTGSNTSLANFALRDAIGLRIQRRARGGAAVAYTAGDPVLLPDMMLLPRIRIGELNIRNVRAYLGDFHIFRLWSMQDEPTLLVGMDLLSQSRAIAIDYATGEVYFRLRDQLRVSTF
jgi:predicted aspartyl protease